MRFIGIDLHSDRFTAAVMELEGNRFVTRLGSYLFGTPSYRSFLDSLNKEDHVLIECCTNAFWFRDQILGRVKDCYVYNTNQARSEGNKTDKIDCKKLAKKLAYYVLMGGTKDDLPTVYVPEEKVRQLRGLISTYQLYKKVKTQLKNRIHSILKQNGICVNRKELDKKGFEERMEQFDVSECWKVQLRSVFRELRYTDERQGGIKEMIYLHGNELFRDEIHLLLSIKGFSPFTAIVLMADAVDVARFSSAKKFCSYLRTSPKVRSSNQRTRVGNINRQSRSTACSLLTQSILHFSQAGEHMSGFYARVRVGKSAGKSRLALIRKIMVSAYHMLKKNEKYYWYEEQMHNRKIKEFHRELERIKADFEEKEVKKKEAA